MHGTIPNLGYTAPGTKLVTLDKAAMSASGVFATTSLDRVGDVLEVGGIITDYHRRNPITLWNHGQELSIPIGVTESPEKAYTVEVDADAGEARCVTYFSQHLLEAEQIYQLIDEGVVRAMSIGYRPLKAKRMPAQQGSIQKPGLFLESVELLEVSFVAVPANQDCIRAALSRSRVCGKSLSPLIRRALAPLVTKPRTTVRGGFAMPKTVKGANADPTEDGAAPADTPAAEPTPDATAPADTPKVPLGAKILGDIHQNLMTLVEYAQTESGALENDRVQSFLLEMADGAFETLQGIEALYAAEYPDLDPLPEAKAPDGDTGAERADDTPAGPSDKPEKADGGDAADDAEGKRAGGKHYSGGAKRLTKAAGNTIRECAEHLGEMGGADNLTKDQRVACKYYSKALGDLAAEPEAAEPAKAGADPDDGMTPAEKAVALQKIKKLELLVAHKKRVAKQKALKNSR